MLHCIVHSLEWEIMFNRPPIRLEFMFFDQVERAADFMCAASGTVA